MKRIVIDQGLPWTAASALRSKYWGANHVREIGISILESAWRDHKAAIDKGCIVRISNPGDAGATLTAEMSSG